MKTSEIRPKELFHRYLELSRIDGEKLDPVHFVSIPCPACEATESKRKFKKNGFQYSICTHCGSLFCSIRPTESQLDSFYEGGASSKYWTEVFFPAVAEMRREKMFRKKAADLAGLLNKKNISPSSICDVGAGSGVFLEELQKHLPHSSIHAVEPNPKAAEICRGKGIETLTCVAQNSGAWESRFDLIISSEVVEHVFSPRHFIESLFNLAAPKGFVLITGLGYEGFDILTLQDSSESVFPPHHLNFLSIKGFETLFRSVGFKEIEINTPGVLDVDIVLESDACPDFLKVVASRGLSALNEFQEFLRKHKLSSHIWVLAQK